MITCWSISSRHSTRRPRALRTDGMGRGWDEDPEYGTPKPPVWWWALSIAVFVAVIIVFAAASSHDRSTRRTGGPASTSTAVHE